MNTPTDASRIDDFNIIMCIMISQLCLNNNICICGDLNIDMLNPNNSDLYVFEMIRTFMFLPLISVPTRK